MLRSSILLLLVACGAPPAPPVPGTYTPTGPAIVRGGGFTVHRDLLEAALTRLPAEQRDRMGPEDQAKLGVDALLLTEALYARALQDGVLDRPGTEARVALAVREAVAAIELEDLTGKAVSDEAIRAAYEARKVQFARKQARVRQILVADEAAATQVAERLRGGADAATVAAEASLDKGSAERGGDLGWVVQNQLPAELDAALFAGAATGVLDPVASGDRWAVLVVEERRDMVPLDEVRTRLERMIRQEALEAEVRALREQLAPEWLIPPGQILPAASQGG